MISPFKATVDNVVKLVNLIKVMELPVLLWVSIPCTGGTRLTDLNWAIGSDLTREKIEAHRELYRSLVHNLRRIYACVVEPGVHVAIEWPNSCKYLKFLAVRQFIDKYDLKTYRFDGCMYGLTTANGVSPIRKPWRVDTNVDFGTYLSRKCDGTHEHVHCCGKHARDSSHYTEELVMCIHEAWGRYSKTSYPNVENVSGTHLQTLASDVQPRPIVPKHHHALNHANVAFARAGPYVSYAMCALAQDQPRPAPAAPSSPVRHSDPSRRDMAAMVHVVTTVG